MALDFQQVQEQIKVIGDGALDREQHLKSLLEKANQSMERWNTAFDHLNRKVEEALDRDPYIRCARPIQPGNGQPEPLKSAVQTPPLPKQATILAADGSQILPDRHAEVQYSLINVGAISMDLGSSRPPHTKITSNLIYSDEQSDSPDGLISEFILSVRRDSQERSILAELAKEAEPPVVTFTDGPIELWGARGSEEETRAFQENLRAYLASLNDLCQQGVIAGGYVDKPGSNLVVRLLEITEASPEQLADLKTYRPLRGVTDLDLFRSLLQPGERSAVFTIQSQSDRYYKDDLALHFFYLNVGRQDHSWLARVEIPAWVVKDRDKLDILQAVLVDQCHMMGSRHFPYLLHRAHETAVVTFQEKEQVTQMIALELRRRGVEVGEASHKQESKELAGRTRYTK